MSPGSAALVQDEAGRILLEHRQDSERWGLPGGAMDLGETAADTVVRETREKTGLEIAPHRLLDLHSGSETVYPNGDRVFIFSMLFECCIVGGQLRPDGRESLEAHLFPPDDLPSLVPEHETRLKRRAGEPGPCWNFCLKCGLVDHWTAAG